MGLFDKILGGLVKNDLGKLLMKVLIGKREHGRLKALPVGETEQLPLIRTDLPGAGYFELMIYARKLDD